MEDEDGRDSLPALNEGDEAVSLSDILAARDSSLVEEELWALCRECCLVLEVVNNSPDMFQTLCITPDTVAFDSAGNVCFLDLDADPEPLYIPPEYDNVGNTYKSHLFSLGMTLLYAAEYNGEPGRPEISEELRELFGCMTSENLTTRPNLELVITQCEEELCGKSSQEVCCAIGTFLPPYTPGPDVPEVNCVSLADVTAGLTAYLQSQNKLINNNTDSDTNRDSTDHIEQNFDDTEYHKFYESQHLQSEYQNNSQQDYQSYYDSELQHSASVDLCDSHQLSPSQIVKNSEPGFETFYDYQKLTFPPSQFPQNPDHGFQVFRDHNQPSPSSNQLPQQQSTPNHQFDSPPQYFSSPLTSPLHLGEAEEDMPTRNVLTGPPQPTGNRGPGLSPYTKKPSPRTSQSTQKQNKPPLPKKPERISQSFQNDSGVVTDNFVNSELESPDKIQKRQTNIDGINGGHINGYYSGEGHIKQEVGGKTYTVVEAESFINQQKRKELTPSTADNSMTEDKPKLAKRRRGMTIGEVLDAVDRYLTEEELWALCREGTLALQRKKKHLPAYLSPDTLVLRENGNLSFKAIPEDKPLEVIFMSPELQQRGQLSEKTCLYGLGITLRCGGGKKYGSVSSMSVSKDLQDLVEWMTESENNKRPNIENVIEVCNKHQEKIGVTSFTCCQNLFQEAYVKMGNDVSQPEPQQPVARETNSAQGSNSLQSSSAFKPVKGSWVKPTTGNGPSPGAFQPIDKPKAEKPKSSLPQAYLSAATHFKPIVLQQAGTPPVTEQIDKQTKDSQPNEKDKEVVKKLKELKKNLMKHRQPAPPTKEDKSPKYPQQMEQDNQSVPSNWQKSQPSGEVTGKEEITSKSEAGTLESLLSEIKKQGAVPDMQSLAASIAQHLQNQLNPSNVTGQNPPSVDISQGQGFSQYGYPSSGQTSQNHMVPGMLPNLNIPPQYQQHLVGQTMTLPMQYGGAALYSSGFPGQVQLQQDPRTGYLQLVPVNFMQVPPSSGTSQVVEQNINNDISRLSESNRTPKPRIPFSNYDGAIRDGSLSDSNKPSPRNGRTARDLIQKTAYLRDRDRRSSMFPESSFHSYSSGHGVQYNGVMRSRSMHALDRDDNIEHFYSDGEIMKTSSHNMALKPGLVYDDSVLHLNRGQLIQNNAAISSFDRDQVGGRGPSERDAGNNGGRYFIQPPKTRSQSSSPSPSKDSGVSGMNMGGVRPPAPGSLMDRLLSNFNLTQQQKLGRVVHLLREEFAFDGYMENGVEDLAMAEYIASLGNLKWETFVGAITEKYSDLYWATELLANLFDAVNGGQRPGLIEGHQQLTDIATQSKFGARPRSHLAPRQQESDSTDNENYERRRRYRKKHNIEKPRSSSMHNLATETGQFTVFQSDGAELSDSNARSKINRRLSDHIDNLEIRQLNPSENQNYNQLEHNNDSEKIELNNNTSLLNERLCDVSQNTSTATAPSTSHSEQLQGDNSDVNSPPSSKSSTHHNSFNKNDINQRNEVMTRTSSLSSHSSNRSDKHDVTGQLHRHLSRLSLTENIKEEMAAQKRKGQVVYHWSMIDLCMTTEVEKFRQDIDEENPDTLKSQLAALSQQLMMERKMRKKSQDFYSKMMESPKTNKGDQKSQMSQVSKDITDMTSRIRFLDLCITHVQMLQAELHGIHSSYLYSMITCPIGSPLQLKPCQENPTLQFQNLKDPHTGSEVPALHGGTPEGLISYLFASSTLNDGYIHQFLYCFRYFTTPKQVLNFIIEKYKSAYSSKSGETNLVRIQMRAVDLIHFWIEGYYSVDFEDNEELIKTVVSFIKQGNLSTSEEGQAIQDLLGNCKDGRHLDLSSGTAEDDVHIYHPGLPKKWESLKAIMKGKTPSPKDKATVKPGLAVCIDNKHRDGVSQGDVYLPRTSRRTDAFALADYTSQNIAEQLTLIEQGLFQLTHPVHYLDSKSRGITVALTMTGTRAPSMIRLNSQAQLEENPTNTGSSLFVTNMSHDTAIQRMIDHAQEVSHWVASEIVSCSSGKSQIAVLSKFLHTAQICKDMRNYSSCMAILDGLENLIIKQLPVWKNLSGKYVDILEDLNNTRMFLKNDARSLMDNKDSHLFPTIPSILLFLLHVQQQEIGGFTLANQMYKWSKMRSICQVIDQIRIFKNHIYGFEPNYELQDILQQRMREFSGQDVHIIASQHDTNYQKMPSGGISAAFRKVRKKVQAK